MGNYAILVGKTNDIASFERNESDEELSLGADLAPVAWFALFDKEEIVVTEPNDSAPEYHWRCLSLLTTKEKALARLAKRKATLLTIFPKFSEKYLTALTEAVEKMKRSHIQIILSDLDDQFAEENRAMLESFLQTFDSQDMELWRDLLGYAGCKLGKTIGDLEYDPEIVVNSFVGWVSGQPSPDECLIEPPKKPQRPWWKVW